MKKLVPFNNAHFSKEIPKKINKLFNSKFVQTAAGFSYSKKYWFKSNVIKSWQG